MKKRPRSTPTRQAPPRALVSRLRTLETTVEQNRRDLDLTFRRIAQMQVELDALKKSNGGR